MRKILAALMTLLSQCSSLFAQNWQTVPAGDTNHFVINDTIGALYGQLRVIWIDSSKANGNFTTHYFYPALRPKNSTSYLNSPGCLDTAGASWLGKTYVREQAGDECYFNLNQDTIRIKTRAGLGESWILSQHGGGISFQATVSGLDTASIDGALDSVKVISIQAYQGGVPVANIHNNQIILSKNHGYLRALEWIYFGTPYSPDPFLKDERGHNRLPESVRQAKLVATPDKFNPGNEWISEERQDNYSGGLYYQNLYKKSTQDSVIAKVQSGAGYNVTVYRRIRITAFDVGTNVLTDDTMTQMVIFFLDTVSGPPPYRIADVLPEYNRFILPGFSQFSQTVNTVDAPVYAVSQGCNGKVVLSSARSSELPYLLSQGDSCYYYQIPLGNDIPILFEYRYSEGDGLEFSADGIYYMRNFLQNTYYNVNGCTYGLKYNVLLPADEFALLSLMQKKDHAELQWMTENEQGVRNFEIQRKVDGTDFVSAGQVNALGHTGTRTTYSFGDPIREAWMGKDLQYRVKMIDEDGKEKYSNVLSLHLKENASPLVVPNPFRDEIILSKVEPNAELHLELANVCGVKIFSAMRMTNSAGGVTWDDLEALPSGVYVLRVSGDSGVVLIRKLVKY